MGETTEATTFATDEVRVQLAQDVLDQIAAGVLYGTPKGSWFVGFEYDVAKKVYTDLSLDIEDEGDSAVQTYEAPDDEDEEDAKHDSPYFVLGTRSENTSDSSICATVRDLDLQEMLQRTGGKCCVCGIGSLVVAAAARYDNMKIGLLESKGVFVAMKDYFSREQLELIEIVYEQADFEYSLVSAERNKATSMWEDVPPGTERLRLIMENIIANNGKFVAGKTPVHGQTEA